MFWNPVESVPRPCATTHDLVQNKRLEDGWIAKEKKAHGVRNFISDSTDRLVALVSIFCQLIMQNHPALIDFTAYYYAFIHTLSRQCTLLLFLALVCRGDGNKATKVSQSILSIPCYDHEGLLLVLQNTPVSSQLCLVHNPQS